MSASKKTTTVDSLIENKASNRFQVKITFIAAISCFIGLAFLNISAVISPYLRCEWEMTTFQVALTSSAVYFGEVVGSSYWGKMGDVVGRKYPLMFVTFGVIYFSLLSAWSTSATWFIVLRFFVGQGMGASFVLTMVYGGEYVKCDMRGLVTTVVLFYMAGGTMYTNIIAYLSINKYGWRIYTMCVAAPLILLLPMLSVLPESIRYLEVSGRVDEIVDILKDMITGNKSEKLPHEIHFQVQKDNKENRGSFTHMFCNYTRKIVALSVIWICLMITFYGFSFLTVYQLQSYSIQAANATKCSFLSDKDLLDVVVINLSNFPFILVCYGILRVFGRRPLFFVCLSLNLVMFVSLLFTLPQFFVKVILFTGQGIIMSSSTFVFQYSLELFPTYIRSTSLGFCATAGKFAAILTPFIFQDMIYWSFPAVIVLLITLTIMSLIALCFLEETKGTHLV